jgi:hypothetical protein
VLAAAVTDHASACAVTPRNDGAFSGLPLYKHRTVLELDAGGGLPSIVYTKNGARC